MKVISFFLLFLNFISYGQCVSSATINTTNYAQSLTQSNSYITISSSVSPFSVVRLDANPRNGYVIMNPGFEAKPIGNNAFTAQPLDGCGAQVPSRVSQTQNYDSLNFSSDLTIYPNPVDNFLNIYTVLAVKEYYIYDILGNLIYKQKKQFKEEVIDVSQLPQGIYIFLIKTEDNIEHYKKFIKK